MCDEEASLIEFSRKLGSKKMPQLMIEMICILYDSNDRRTGLSRAQCSVSWLR